MNSKKYFTLLLVLYVLVRIPLMISNQLLSDELDVTAIADQFTRISHLPLPLLDFQKRPYGATSLFDAAFAVPFFLVFGKTLFALKMASLVWYIFPLMAWYCVWRGYYSPKKTFFILLFFVLSPEMVFYSLTYGHQHFETILWLALTLILFRQFLQGKLGESWGGFLLGLFGGLTCWLNIVNIFAPAFLCLQILFLKETRIRKSVFFGIYIPVFLIGVSPLIYYNAKYSMTGYLVVKDIFTMIDGSSNYFFQRFAWVFQHGIPGLFVFQKFPPVPKFILTGFFTFSYLASLVYLVWKKRKLLFTFRGDKGFDIESFGLVYQVLLIAMAMASGRIYSKEYLLPMIPFIGMTLVIGISQLSKILGVICGNWLKTSLAIFCISAWILGDWGLVRWNKWGEAFHIKGYSDVLLAQRLVNNLYVNQDIVAFQRKFELFLEGHTTEDKKRLWLVVLNQLPIKHTSDRNFFLAINEVEEEIRPVFYEHFGWSVGRTSQWNVKSQDYKDWITSHSEIYRGFISGLTGSNHGEALQKGLALCLSATFKLKPACYEGLGLLSYQDPYSHKMSLALLSLYPKVEERHRSFYLVGLGRHYVRKWLYDSDDLSQPPGPINNLEREEWNWFDTSAVADFSISLSTEEKKWFNRGIEEESSLQVEDAFLREKVLEKLRL